MTRETRIAMLVGLLFIVLFGMVLSELTGTAPPASPADRVPPGPRPYVFTPSPEPVRPDLQPVTPRQTASGRGRSVHRTEVASRPPRERGEVHVALGRRGLSAMATRRQPRQGTPGASTVTSAPRAVERTYTVQPNDSLIKIARKVYGAAHGREYRLIFKANRDRLTDEASIRVGQKLVIPPRAPQTRAARRIEPRPRAGVRPSSPAGAQRPAGGEDPREVTIAELEARFDARAARVRRAQPRTYVVRQGDTLTEIARRTLGDPSREAVRKIYRANQDRLRSPNVLPVGTKLRIPGRSQAAAGAR